MKKIRSAYSGTVRVPHPVLGLDAKGNSRQVHPVKQEFKKQVDINTIVARARNGQVPPAWMTSRTPFYGDFTETPRSFQEAFDLTTKAVQAFESLPIELRREIDHDPRRISELTLEQYKRFGLVNEPEASAAPSGATEPSASQRVQGDRDLPGKAPVGANKAPVGANKGVQKTPSATEGEE